MTNSPFEPPQGDPSEVRSEARSEANEQERRRRLGGSPLDFDEWVALLVAFGVLGSIFWWSIRPRVGEAGGWLGGFGGGNVGILQGDAAGRDAAGGLGLAGDGEGVDFLAGRSDRDDSDKDDDSIAFFNDDGALKQRRPGVGAVAATGAGLAGIAAADGATAEPAETEQVEAVVPVAEEETTPEEAAEEPAEEPAAEELTAETEETPAEVEAEPAATEETVAEETPAATEEEAVEEPIAVSNEALETSIPEISEDSWLYPFAASLEEKDRLGELPTTETFDIDAPVTRAEFAALVSQAEQVEGKATQAAEKFEDIGESFWAAPRISGALDTGFMSGYGTLADGRQLFGPGEEIPRYQALVAIASGLNLTPPEDVDGILSKYNTEGMPPWAKEKVAAALANGLVINPNDQTKLDPLRSTTRGEATAMLQQVLQREGKVENVESEVTVTP